ncbi:MAG: hypothetical protein WC451_05350 [Patescibacteria group bacterium]|jgi:hypothetical protein
MSYENMLFAKAMAKEKEGLEKQVDKNKRIRNFNQTLGSIFNVLGVTVNPLFALGGTATEWLNPEKKYKTDLFLSDTAKSLNRERKENVPEWYNALIDVGTAYAGYELGGKEIGQGLLSKLGLGKSGVSNINYANTNFGKSLLGAKNTKAYNVFDQADILLKNGLSTGNTNKSWLDVFGGGL